jgi:ATP-dependent DNA ligase
MLAKTVTNLPVGPDWAFEPKSDGYGVLAFGTSTTARGTEVVLQSRQQRMLTRHFPDIAATLDTDTDTVLDGSW